MSRGLTDIWGSISTLPGVHTGAHVAMPDKGKRTPALGVKINAQIHFSKNLDVGPLWPFLSSSTPQGSGTQKPVNRSCERAQINNCTLHANANVPCRGAAFTRCRCPHSDTPNRYRPVFPDTVAGCGTPLRSKETVPLSTMTSIWSPVGRGFVFLWELS